MSLTNSMNGTIPVHEILIKDQFITGADYEKIQLFSKKSGLSFVKIALTFGYISRKNYERSLINAGYIFNHDVRDEPIDNDVVNKLDLKHIINYFALPIRIEDNKVVTLMADPTDQEFIDFVFKAYGMEAEVILASDLEITWMSHKLLGEPYVNHAVYSLLKKDSESSALVTFSPAQLLVIFVGLAIVVGGLFIDFGQISIILNVMISSFFLISIVFKLFLALVGSRFELHQAVSREEIRKVSDEDMPIFTIHLPVYKEDKLIKKLIWNLQSLDYPRECLDIKLLIEEDDNKTLNAVKDLNFPAIFDVIVVPFKQPKTKPKACNYGLLFSRGKYLTIYDAEDIPDTDQLKKVITLFEKLPENYICIQCALNYFNRNENFLTRMFTLEYSYWFDYMLPGLDTLDIPIPLGGTSNHFKLDKLIELGGWDPFNVTEDADLGLRAYDKGYKVSIVNSTTYEEANNEPFNWIRQRSRWIKGYMQTYLVHMRNPYKLYKKLGLKGFLGFSFFIGATPLTFLVYPILLSVFFAYVIFDFSFIRALFPNWVLFISIFNLLVGNVLMVYINMMAVFKRRYYELILFSLANPVYWIMHSISAYMGLYQLIIKPFYWEKTNHGLSKTTSNQQIKI